MLDTNILIYAIKHPLSPVVDRIIDQAVRGELCISAVTYGELEVGVLKSAWPEKSRKAVEAVLSGIPTLAYDQLAACWYAKLKTKLEREGTPVDDPDLMIGGHAERICTLLAPFSYRNSTVSLSWVPRTMESSTKSRSLSVIRS